MTDGLLDLESRRAMVQKFVFKGQYAGRLHHAKNRLTGAVRVISLHVNLSAADNHINNGETSTPIKDDQDAIYRVCHTLDHEWMHYAFMKVGHSDSLEQERMIYASIGNGGNDFFNIYYKIDKNPAWENKVVNHE